MCNSRCTYAIFDRTRIFIIPNHIGWNYYDCNVKPVQPATLDEITNRVFEELLQGKAENYRNPVAENVASAHVSTINRLTRSVY